VRDVDKESEVDSSDDDRSKMLSSPQDVARHHCGFCDIDVSCSQCLHTHTHTHPFNGPFSETTRVGRYQKGKTGLDFTEARDSE